MFESPLRAAPRHKIVWFILSICVGLFYFGCSSLEARYIPVRVENCAVLACQIKESGRRRWNQTQFNINIIKIFAFCIF